MAPTLADIATQSLDIIFTHDRSGFFGRAIAALTRHRGEAPTLATHMECLRDPQTVMLYHYRRGPCAVSVMRRSMEFTAANRGWCVFRYRAGYDSEQIDRARALIDDSLANDKYSLGEIGLNIADGVLGWIWGSRVVAARRLGGMWERNRICSTGTSRFYLREGAGGLPPQAGMFDPDAACDHMVDDHATWQCVGYGGDWPVQMVVT